MSRSETFTSKVVSSDSLNGLVLPLSTTGSPFTTAAKEGCTYRLT